MRRTGIDLIAVEWTVALGLNYESGDNATERGGFVRLRGQETDDGRTLRTKRVIAVEITIFRKDRVAGNNTGSGRSV